MCAYRLLIDVEARRVHNVDSLPPSGEDPYGHSLLSPLQSAVPRMHDTPRSHAQASRRAVSALRHDAAECRQLLASLALAQQQAAGSMAARAQGAGQVAARIQEQGRLPAGVRTICAPRQGALYIAVWLRFQAARHMCIHWINEVQ